MNETELSKKEEEITSKYRSFLNEVREAFDRHCDQIKAETMKKFEAIPKDAEEERQKIVDDQKAELDKTLAELKQILAKKKLEFRTQLEEIADLREQQSFNIDAELAEIEADHTKHAA